MLHRNNVDCHFLCIPTSWTVRKGIAVEPIVRVFEFQFAFEFQRPLKLFHFIVCPSLIPRK